MRFPGKTCNSKSSIALRLRRRMRKNDNCDLPQEYGVKIKGYWFGKGRFLFQPALREVAFSHDLVVIDQARTDLSSIHFLIPLSFFKLKKTVCIGRKSASRPSCFSNGYKERTLNCVDWWFAYTAGTARYLQEHGVSPAKIAAIQSSLDTRAIQMCVKNVSSKTLERRDFRAVLGIDPSAPGIFRGHARGEVHCPSSRRGNSAEDSRQLIVVGGGRTKRRLGAAVAHLSSIHFVGPEFGERKSQLLAIADVFLLPGRVGLADPRWICRRSALLS